MISSAPRRSLLAPAIPVLLLLLGWFPNSTTAGCCGCCCMPGCCCMKPCQCVNPPLLIKLPRTCPCCCCCKPCCCKCCCCKPCCCCGGGGGRRRRRREAVASFQRQWAFQHPIHSVLPVSDGSLSPAQQPPIDSEPIEQTLPYVEEPNILPTPGPVGTNMDLLNVTPVTASLPAWLLGNRRVDAEDKHPLLTNFIPVLKTLLRWPKWIIDEMSSSMGTQKGPYEKSRLLSDKSF